MYLSSYAGEILVVGRRHHPSAITTRRFVPFPEPRWSRSLYAGHGSAPNSHGPCRPPSPLSRQVRTVETVWRRARPTGRPVYRSPVSALTPSSPIDTSGSQVTHSVYSYFHIVLATHLYATRSGFIVCIVRPLHDASGLFVGPSTTRSARQPGCRDRCDRRRCDGRMHVGGRLRQRGLPGGFLCGADLRRRHPQRRRDR
jgi:hypothetical protein